MPKNSGNKLNQIAEGKSQQEVKREAAIEKRLRMAGEDMTPQIAAANPGVPQVGTGTVVFRGLSGGMNANLPVAVQNAQQWSNTAVPAGGQLSPDKNPIRPTPNTGTAGYWGQYNAPKAQAGGQLSPDKNPVLQQPRPAINPFGTAGMYSFNQNFPNFQLPSANQPQAQIVASDGTVNPPVPTGTFTPGGGNEQEWRNWWNWQAQHPTESRALLTQMAAAQGQPDPFAVHIPTIDEIQKMKWEQRRRGWEEGGSSGQSYGSGFTPSYNPLASERDLIGGSFGNNAISASWRIGG